MALRFQLDENLRGGGLWQAILQHNARGVDVLDVVRVGDPPDLPTGSTDPALLSWAEREGRILVTRDSQTMPRYLADHLQAGHHSPGVLLVRRRCPLPQVLGELVLHAHAGNPVDYQDRIAYIP
jgi:GAF domain-containing protein